MAKKQTKVQKVARKSPKGRGKKSRKASPRTKVIVRYVQMPVLPQQLSARKLTPMQGRQVIVQEQPGGFGTAVGHGLGAGAGFAVGEGVVGELFDDW